MVCTALDSHNVVCANRSGCQSRALYPPITGPTQEIAEIKLPDLNCRSVESAIRTVLGTARNMGIAVKEATSS